MNIVEQFKKGWHTSEFWVSIVALVGAVSVPLFGVEVDTEGAIGLISAVFAAVGYAGSRTWLKTKRVEAVTALAVAEAVPAVALEEDDLLDEVVDKTDFDGPVTEPDDPSRGHEPGGFTGTVA